MELEEIDLVVQLNESGLIVKQGVVTRLVLSAGYSAKEASRCALAVHGKDIE